MEGGYQTSKATFAVRWDYSQFDNDNQTFKWTNPFFGNNQLDTSYLPPNNTFNKFTLSGNYRDLPWKSVISARYTWAKTTSDVVARARPSSTRGLSYAPTLPSTEQLQRREHQPVVRAGVDRHAASQTSTRASSITGRSWRTIRRSSSTATRRHNPLAGGLGCGNFTPAGGAPTATVGNCENELYNYTKNNVGFDVWWKFLRGNRLGFGWDYNDVDQTRVDYDKAHWNKVWAEYKNTMLDTFSGRLKYQYIKKDATLNFSNQGINGGANNPNYLIPYTSAFDMQSSTTNLLKLYLDWAPMQNVGVSFEGTWGKVDFDDVTFGRTSSDRQGYFLSGNWTASERIKLNAFGSWEQAKYPSNHRYIGTVA